MGLYLQLAAVSWAFFQAALGSDTPRLQPEIAPIGERNEDGDSDISLRNGVVLQTTGCPQLITQEDARQRMDDSTLPGNVMYLTSEGRGRAGNHFLVISSHLAMAYCCKSRVLSLPGYEEGRPAGIGQEEYRSTDRFFDFSGVDFMPLPEYDGLHGRPNVCPPISSLKGHQAFRLTGVHPDLLSCMNRVYLRGCEAEYFSPLIRSLDFCEPSAPTEGRSSSASGSDKAVEAITNLEASHLVLRRELDSRDPALDPPMPGQSSAGSLIIHIRSGNIFKRRNIRLVGANFPGFGQPPLQFYLKVIGSREWSDISVLTYVQAESDVNPAFAALEMLERTGALGPRFHTHKNRPLLTDIRAMLCADALVASRSTLHFLTFAHSRASHYYVPSECGPGTYKRGYRWRGGARNPNPDNTTLLCLEKPRAEVYGLEWGTQESSYGLYDGWHDTDEQLLKMVLYDGVKGLVRCCA